MATKPKRKAKAKARAKPKAKPKVKAKGPGRGGKRAGAGRPKSPLTVAKENFQQFQTKQLDLGITVEDPVEFLLGVMGNTEAPTEMRVACAKAAAPFVKPRLAAKQHVIEDEAGVTVTLVSYADLQKL